MKLHQLTRSKGITDKANKRGRGNATKGNTSGKGHKGQKARSGYKKKLVFEGGQTPFIQRMPKARGFKRHFKLVEDITVINLSDLESNKNIESGATLNKESFVSLGVISRPQQKLKILANGEINKKLTFQGVDYFSKTAIEKIQASGGTVQAQE